MMPRQPARKDCYRSSQKPDAVGVGFFFDSDKPCPSLNQLLGCLRMQAETYPSNLNQVMLAEERVEGHPFPLIPDSIFA